MPGLTAETRTNPNVWDYINSERRLAINQDLF
jgi:hypothetical protein